MPELQPVRQDERIARANQHPLLPDSPHDMGIRLAMNLNKEIGDNLRNLAELLLIKDYEGSTISRGVRELIAARVSAENSCFFCMDSHGEFSIARFKMESIDFNAEEIVNSVKCGIDDNIPENLKPLLKLATKIAKDPLSSTPEDAEAILNKGFTKQDVELTVLIASSFKMYNSLVDSFRAITPADISVYKEMTKRIIEEGYLRKTD